MKNQSSFYQMWKQYKENGLGSAISSVFAPPNAQQAAFLRNFMKHQRNRSLWEKPLVELEIVVFDLETTGFYPEQGDEILSIGAIALKGDRMLEETFHRIVRIEQPVPPKILELTGISDEMSKHGDTLIDALQDFFQFVHRRLLLAHGAAHDKSFLNHALRKTSRTSFTHKTLDTMMIAKWLQPDLEDYSLDVLLRLYGIPVAGRHNALQDSMMTAHLWCCFLQQIKAKQVVTLGDLYMYLSR